MKSLRLLTFALLVSALSAPAQENLITNGTFDERLTGWSHLDLVSWNLDGASGPGSARISFPTHPEGGDTLIQCVPVEGGRLYDLSAAALLPKSEDASGGLSIRIQWHPLGGCQGPILRGAPTLAFSYREPVGWQTLEERRIPAPFEAVSALIVIISHAAGQRPYSMLVDDIRLRRSGEYEDYFIPAVASASGARGERFETDLWIHNPAPATREFVLTLNSGGRFLTPTLFRVGPKQTRYLRDVISQVTSQRNVTGALQVSYDPRGGPMLISARVVTVHDSSPGNGTAIPAYWRKESRTSALFSGLSLGRGDTVNANRVNAGAFNPNEAPVSVRFELFDGDGTSLGQLERNLEPGGWLQVNDIFGQLGIDAASTEGAYLTSSAHLPLFPFVIAVDNRSGDGTWLAPQEIPEGLSPRQ